jgi:hypothetical protein
MMTQFNSLLEGSQQIAKCSHGKINLSTPLPKLKVMGTVHEVCGPRLQELHDEDQEFISSLNQETILTVNGNCLTFVDSNTRDQHCIIYFEVVLEFIKH